MRISAAGRLTRGSSTKMSKFKYWQKILIGAIATTKPALSLYPVVKGAIIPRPTSPSVVGTNQKFDVCTYRTNQ